MTGSLSPGRRQEQAAAPDPLAADVREGLLSEVPTLPTHCLYDNRGSALFEQITRQPEYYQTRTEEALLESVAGRIVDRCGPRELVELGSGVGRKIRMLLDAMRDRGSLERCILFDINSSYLETSVRRLAEEYPEAVVTGVHGDFHQDLGEIGVGRHRLMLLLAGTMGNIPPDDLPPFLYRLGACLGSGDAFLVGVDQVKDPDRLQAAYNDHAGVTAAFNRNILNVMNRKLGADFDQEAWEHVAFYDEKHAWIEMRLRASSDQRVTVPDAGLDLEFEAGDEIRTEISAKYTRESLQRRLATTDLSLTDWYEDDERLFALALLTRDGEQAC